MNEIDLSQMDLNLLVTFEVLMQTRSVTGAAERLGKTQSAVSHALGRLREQLGDPLMVRVGGRMHPSPFAEQLIEDLRPVLGGLRRIMSPKDGFDPVSSDRVFRVAIPTLTHVIADVSMRVAKEAPGVRIEWLPAHHHVYAELSEGLIDLAHLGGSPRLPDGLEHEVMDRFTWTTFARQDHPAVENWGVDAWRTYPHLMVNVTRSTPNPLVANATLADGGRIVKSLIADSAGVAGILARSDLLGTFPPILLALDMERYGLCALRPPVDLGPVMIRFFWSARLANDAGSRWFRAIVLDCYRRHHARAEAMIRD